MTLIGQAEHDYLAQCILISKDKKFIDKVKKEIFLQLIKYQEIQLQKKFNKQWNFNAY